MLVSAIKKLISALLVAVICLTVLPAVSFNSFAIDGVTMRLEKLENYFPHGWYYNHKVVTESDKRISLLEGRDESYAESVSRYPCVDHDGEAQIGVYDCNYFDGGYQCHGFAARLFYEIFGVRQSTMEKNRKAPFDIKPGDLVRLKNDTHSAIVLSVNGDSFTVAECNIAENSQADSCKISWGRSYKLSDITYYVRASNYVKVSTDTNWKNIEEKAYLGNSFYAAIYNASENKVLGVDAENNVVFQTYNVSEGQIWKFTRLKNGSYKIQNCKNARVLQVESAAASGKAKVTSGSYDGSNKQLWAFYGSGKELYLSADCGISVLCGDAEGNICVDTKRVDSAMIFTLIKKQTPVASLLKAKGANGYVALSWSKGDYTKVFDLQLYNASSKLYKEYKNLTVTALKVTLPAGNYSARIVSKNAYSQTSGNTVYFTVGKKGVLGNTAKVSATQTVSSVSLSWTPVPDALGYGIFYRSAGHWKGLAATGKTSYTINRLTSGKKYTIAIRAFKKVGGKTVWADTSTAFTAATMLKAPDKLTATQTTSSVTLTWSSLLQADGYRVFRKTASGWSIIETTAKTQSTVTSLTSGTSYIFAVRPYMKTTVGVVWGELKTLTTATKPDAPKLTVSDVKNLRAKIRWDKVRGADGYQVYYKFDNSAAYTHLANYNAGNGGVELTKLKNGVYYTFAVRAYKTVGGKNIYGSYSIIRFQAKYV